MRRVIDWGIPISTAHVSSDNSVSQPIPGYNSYCYMLGTSPSVMCLFYNHLCHESLKFITLTQMIYSYCNNKCT